MSNTILSLTTITLGGIHACNITNLTNITRGDIRESNIILEYHLSFDYVEKIMAYVVNYAEA